MRNRVLFAYRDTSGTFNTGLPWYTAQYHDNNTDYQSVSILRDQSVDGDGVFTNGTREQGSTFPSCQAPSLFRAGIYIETSG